MRNKELFAKEYEAHPFFSKKSKADCIDYLAQNKGRFKIASLDWITEENAKVLERIIQLDSPDEIYIEFGKFMSSQECALNNIFYREDCLEYLLTLDIDSKDAFDIADSVRKGKWGIKELFKVRTDLPKDFLKWSEGVKYLPSGERIFETFEVI